MANFDAIKLQKRLNEIEELKKQKAQIEEKLAQLTGLLSEASQPPIGFDYKTAVLSLLQNTSHQEFSIDDVCREISRMYKFDADRKAISNRLNYLTDRDKKLRRVEGKRGIYKATSLDNGLDNPL